MITLNACPTLAAADDIRLVTCGIFNDPIAVVAGDCLSICAAFTGVVTGKLRNCATADVAGGTAGTAAVVFVAGVAAVVVAVPVEDPLPSDKDTLTSTPLL